MNCKRFLFSVFYATMKVDNWKMPLTDLMFTMINRRGITLSLELRNYMKTAHPGMEISKPGYLKQRMKLNPLAFYELYRHHNRNFYADPGFSHFHGYLVLAADGSGINIPTTRETLETFGTSSRKGTKPQASIGLGCLYDVMNRMILESDCCKCKFDEMFVRAANKKTKFDHTSSMSEEKSALKSNFRKFDYYVLLFFSLAFIGWFWEVALFFFTNHAFINRGIYKGPYLPIYGVGGLLLCFLFRSYRRKPFRLFLLSMFVCSVLEYLTSYFLELRWGSRWWDYSGHFLNLNGRVCLLGAVVFGLGGTALVCLFLPLYEKAYHRLSGKWRLVLCLLLLIVFITDATYCAVWPNTGDGISGM